MEYFLLLLSLVLFYLAYRLKSKNMQLLIPSKKLEEIGKEYLEKITENFNINMSKAQSINNKVDPNFINPCTKNNYDPSIIPFFTIIYATQSGTSKKFAEELQKEASDNLKLKCQLLNISDIKSINDLNDNMLLVFIISTYGSGGPTDDCIDFNQMIEEDKFWENLNNKNLTYAIFGLGSIYYSKFNAQAKLFDKIFQKNSIIRICDIGLGDDSQKIHNDFIKWKNELFWPKVYEYFKDNKDKYKEFKRTSHSTKVNIKDMYTMNIVAKDKANNIQIPLKAFNRELVKFTQAKSAVIESICELRQQNKNGSSLKVTFNIKDSDLSYKTADTIGIYPKNTKENVDKVITHMGYNKDDVVDYTFINEEVRNTKLQLPLPNNISIEEALTTIIDLSCQISKDILFKIKKYVKDEDQCNSISSIINKSELLNDFYLKRYNFIDLIEQYNSISIPFNILIQILPQITPRLYTVASSPNKNKDTFDIAISLVEWKNYKGEKRFGLNSTYLNNLYLSKSTDSTKITINNSIFKLPEETTTPMLMICTGTGIAPYISFLQELEFINKMPYETYLIFGSKNKDSDFLYEKELQRFKDIKCLKELHCAFSRDQNEKIYVQNVLQDKYKDKLNELVNKEKMIIYICGNLSMGRQIEQVLNNILGKDKVNEINSNDQLIKEYWENS